MVLTNVYGAALTIRATLPALKDSRGHLLLTSSVAGGRVLSGSLYEVYYGLSYAQVARLGVEPARDRRRPATAPALYRLCCELAGEEPGRWSVAANGRVLEQEQILTTHNLATLMDAYEYYEQCRDAAAALFGS